MTAEQCTADFMPQDRMDPSWDKLSGASENLVTKLSKHRRRILCRTAGQLFGIALGCQSGLSAHAAEPDLGPALLQAEQVVVVISEDWNSSQGLLYSFSRQGADWVAAPIRGPVSLGRNGLAWGSGIHPAQEGLQKQEGDGKAPAGIFEFGTAFGYAPSLQIAMPYQGMTAWDYCMDVATSPYYNQLVDSRVVGESGVAGSSEPMRLDLLTRDDQRYRAGLVIRHNPLNIAGGGSCIFMHQWRREGAPTAGCTALSAPLMDALLAWLNPAAKPLYILLPRAEYQARQRSWQLPSVAYP